MRHAIFVVGVVVAAGCGSSTPDPCSGVSGACISARVEGTVKSLDQLQFSIFGATTMTASSPMTPASPPFGLPVKVGIVPPAGSSGTITISLEGMLAGTALAHDVESVTLVNGRGTVKFTLNDGTADLGIVPDLATPDLSPPPPITVTASPSPLVARELEPFNLVVSTSDPLGQPSSVTIGSAPTGATVGSDGGVATMAWTPDYTQAGMTTVQELVTASDTTRNANLALTITVLNSVDPVFPAPGDATVKPPLPAGNIIGDFDGDGFADVANCSVTAAALYTVTVVFGDASGLPTSTPLPMARTKQYQFSFGSTMANTRLQVAGGDVDGDGKSDILIADPAANSGVGMVYVLFGSARSVATPRALPAVDPATLSGESGLGNGPLLVGDFNGDGKADFFTTNGGGATNDTIYQFLGAMQPAAGAAGFTTPTKNSVTPGSCNRRIIMSLGDIDADANHTDELLVFDPNVGPTGNCAAQGGLVIVDSVQPSPKPYARPTDTLRGWGGPAAQSMLCDVDGDGRADLVVADGQLGGNAFVFFSSSGVFPTVPTTITLDDSAGHAVKIPAGTGQTYSLAKCAKKFLSNAPATAILGNPGDQSTKPARVDLLSSSTTPMVLRSLPSPVQPADPNFGSVIGSGLGDVNGDKLNDIVVGAVGIGTTPGQFWVVYGR